MLKQKFNRYLSFTLLIFFAALVTGCKSNTLKSESSIADRDKAQSYKHSLVIGGSGTNIPITRKLAQAYMNANPDIKVIIPESLGSTGGIKGVAEGNLDMAIVSRRMFPEEEKLGLRYIPYGQVVIAFAVHPGISIDSLTEGQVYDIFSGKITNWKQVGGADKKISVLIREEKDSSKLVWNKTLKGFSDIRFAGDAILLKTDQAMNEAIASIEGGIGWTDLGTVTTDNLAVRLIKLNNVAPVYELVRRGDYPHVKELAFVIDKGDSRIKSFIEFVNGPQGEKILEESGYMPVTSQQ